MAITFLNNHIGALVTRNLEKQLDTWVIVTIIFHMICYYKFRVSLSILYMGEYLQSSAKVRQLAMLDWIIRFVNSYGYLVLEFLQGVLKVKLARIYVADW